MTDQPSDGAFMAACTLGRTEQIPYAWGTDECMKAARIIDREAVAPAVRDYDNAMAGLLEILQDVMPDTYWVSDSRCQLARHCREQYRHLLEDE